MSGTRAPFPWFGGKSKAAELVWSYLGNPRHYIEPFAGSLAVLLNRPSSPGLETINDLDPYLSNFWRALKADPEQVAHHADFPVSEVDLHARHAWLVKQHDFRRQLEADPEFFDAKVAGWWAWGLSLWIGGEFCGERFWQGPELDWLETEKKRPQVSGSSAGRGVQAPPKQKPKVSSYGGCGVTSVGLGKRPHLMSTKGVQSVTLDIGEWFQALAERLRKVRCCHGDWARVCTDSVVKSSGVTAIFLDPPYTKESGRSRKKLYGKECFQVAKDAAKWARENAGRKGLRIALCGLEGEHDMPGWTIERWKKGPGYGNTGAGVGKKNSEREVIWFSPNCVREGFLF